MNMKRAIAFALFLLAVGTCNKAHATFNAGATYYILYTDTFAGHAGNDITGDGTFNNPYHSSTKAWLTNGGGNNYIVKIGTFGGPEVVVSSIPSGTAANLTWLKAETPRRVRIIRDSALDLSDNDYPCNYFGFEGITWDHPSQKTIIANRFKFKRCFFRGGGAGSNSVNVSVGSNDALSRSPTIWASYGLFEDCVFWGPGGRYDLLIYNSQKMVVRRCVFRNDGNWSCGCSNPQACLTFYDASDSFSQNNIVVDSTGPYEFFESAFLHIANTSPGANLNPDVGNNWWDGSIVLRSGAEGIRKDDGLTSNGNHINNCVLWDLLEGNSFGSAGSSFTITNTLVSRSSFTSGFSSFYDGFNEFATGYGPWTIKDSIIANLAAGGGDDYGGDITGTYLNVYNNATSHSGTGFVTYNPQTNGLKYLTRIEAGSNLATAGSTGGQIGPSIIYKIGGDLTWYGDAGFNTLTNQLLWEGGFPYQDEIKTEMCAPMEVGMYEGWCGTNLSLNRYVNGYIAGSSSPYSDSNQAAGCSGTSLNPSLTNITTGSFTASWTAGSGNYILVVSQNSDFSSPVSSGTVTNNSWGVGGLSANTLYYVEVKDALDPDCAYSSTSGTTSQVSAASSGASFRVNGVRMQGVKFGR